MSAVFLRVLADGILFFSTFFLPWWLVLVVGTLFLFAFRHFYEFFAVALFLDLLYGGGARTVFGFPFFVLLSAVLLYLMAAEAKRRLFLYRP